MRRACLLCLLWVALGFAPGSATMDTVLAAAEACYLEDAEVPRPIARVRAVVRSAAAPWLEVEVLATGAGIDPLPGATELPGVNRRTAEELHELLDDGELQLVLRHQGTAAAGSLRAVERAVLPARRLLRDGSLAAAPPGGPALPVRVLFASAALPEGRSEHYLVARSLPRLLVVVEREGRNARIETIESLGAMPRPGER